jgi:hypothetical protein
MLLYIHRLILNEVYMLSKCHIANRASDTRGFADLAEAGRFKTQEDSNDDYLRDPLPD